MAEQESSSQDRDLPASERKLSKAREQGQVARSRDLASALSLAAGLMALSYLGANLLGGSKALLENALRFDHRVLTGGNQLRTGLFDWTVTLGDQALDIALPILLFCAIGAIAGQLALGGLAFTTHPMAPDFGKISPIKGLGRIFSTHNLMETGKLLIVVMTLMSICALYVYHYAPALPSLAAMDSTAAMSESMRWLRGGALSLLGVLVLAALIDAPLQWFRHQNQLKMTLGEVKQENKESDGDPHVRARIRGRQRELARSRMLAAVPQASVIVTNPTHFAVALRYDEKTMGAPKVVAKGVDLLAAKIREAGALAGVPVLEAAPLARALYAHARIGMEVPPVLYTAVAQVLAYLFQLRQHMNGALAGGAPEMPANLEIPAELDPGYGIAPDDLDQDDGASVRPNGTA